MTAGEFQRAGGQDLGPTSANLVDVNIHLNPQRQRCNSLKISGYRISSNNGGGGRGGEGDDYFFFAQKGGDYSSESIISNIAHWKSCPKYFVLFSH